MRMTKRPFTKLPNFVEIVSMETNHERILNLMKSAPNNTVTPTDCMRLLNMHSSTVSNNLGRLCRKKMITRKSVMANINGVITQVNAYTLVES